jgi:hypothetical protein
MEGVPDDEISLSVLLYSVHGCSIFVVLGLSFIVAVGMVSWARVGDHRWKKRCTFGDLGVSGSLLTHLNTQD